MDEIEAAVKRLVDAKAQAALLIEERDLIIDTRAKLNAQLNDVQAKPTAVNAEITSARAALKALL